MTLINLCLNGLKGEVAWLNSLSNEFYGAWRVEIHPVYRTPYIRKIDKEEVLSGAAFAGCRNCRNGYS